MGKGRHEHSTLALRRMALDRERLFGGDSSIKASEKNDTRTRPSKRAKFSVEKTVSMWNGTMVRRHKLGNVK